MARQCQETTMRKKLLQNTLFAAIAAWALYGVQAHMNTAMLDAASVTTMVAMR
jgi:hypothetical protein